MNVVVLESKTLLELVGKHYKALHTMNFLLHNIKEPIPHGMLFTTSEVTEVLGLTREELREARKLREIKYTVVDKQIFYRISDLIDYKCRLDQDRFRKALKRVTYNIKETSEIL